MRNLFILCTILSVVSAQNLMHLVPAHIICPNVTGDQDILLPSPVDCSVYYRCENGMAVPQSCPRGLQWCQVLTKCTLPVLANCTLNNTLITYSPDQLATYTPYLSTTHSVTSILSENKNSVPTKRECPIDGATIPNPLDCNSYYLCENGDPVSRNCPVGEQYSSWNEICYPPKIANCIYSNSNNKTGDLCLNDIAIPNRENCSTYYRCINGIVALKVCDAGLTYSPWNGDCRNNSDCVKYVSGSTTSSSALDITIDSNQSSPNFYSIFCPFDGAKLPDPFDCNSYFICQGGEPKRLQCPFGNQYNCWDQICESNVTINCINSGNQTDRTCNCSGTTMPDIQNCSTYYKCVQSRVKFDTCPTGLTYNPWLGKCENDDVCKSYLGYNITYTGTTPPTLEITTNVTVNLFSTHSIETATNPINITKATISSNATIVTTANTLNINGVTIKTTIPTTVATTTNTGNTNLTTIVTGASKNISTPVAATSPESSENSSSINTLSPISSFTTTIETTTVSPIITTLPAIANVSTIETTSETSTEANTETTANTNSKTFENTISTISTTKAATTNPAVTVTVASSDSTNISTIVTETSTESSNNTTIITTVNPITSTVESTVGPIITTLPTIVKTNVSTTVTSSETRTEADTVTTANTNSNTTENTISSIPTTISIVTNTGNVNLTTFITGTSTDSTNISTIVTETSTESSDNATIITSVSPINSITSTISPIITTLSAIVNKNISTTETTSETRTEADTLTTANTNSNTVENTISTIPKTISITTNTGNTNQTAIVTEASSDSTNISTIVTETSTESSENGTIITTANQIHSIATTIESTASPIITTLAAIVNTNVSTIETTSDTSTVADTVTAPKTNSNATENTISTMPATLTTTTNTENTNLATTVTAENLNITNISTPVTATSPESSNNSTIITTVSPISSNTTSSEMTVSQINTTLPTIVNTNDVTNIGNTFETITSAGTVTTASTNSMTIETTISTILTTIATTTNPGNTNLTTIVTTANISTPVTARSTESSENLTIITTVSPISSLATTIESTVSPIITTLPTIANTTNVSSIGTTFQTNASTNSITTASTSSNTGENLISTITTRAPTTNPENANLTTMVTAESPDSTNIGTTVTITSLTSTTNSTFIEASTGPISTALVNLTISPIITTTSTIVNITIPFTTGSTPTSSQISTNSTIGTRTSTGSTNSTTVERIISIIPTITVNPETTINTTNATAASVDSTNITTKPASVLCPREDILYPSYIGDCQGYMICVDGQLIQKKCEPPTYYYNCETKKCENITHCCASGGTKTPTTKRVNTTPVITTIPLPSLDSEICPINGAKLPNPIDCRSYYMCESNIPTPQKCPEGKVYSCWDQVCESSNNAICIKQGSQQGQICPNEGEKNVNLDDCSSYYKCNNGKIEIVKCATGTFYNSWFKDCFNFSLAWCQTYPTIPSTSTIEPPPSTRGPSDINSICPMEGAKLPNVLECSSYYICINSQPILQNCNNFQIYSCCDQKCLSISEGQCITFEDSTYGNCSINGLQLPNINDCSSYYECNNNSITAIKCPDGMMYNSWFKKCVEDSFAHCQTISTPASAFTILGVSSLTVSPAPNICPVDGAQLPDPTNCAAYYVCQNGLPVSQTCSEGEQYSCWDQSCVTSSSNSVCITNGNQEGLKCSIEGEMLPNIGDCSSFYICINGKVELHICASGSIYSEWFKMCVNASLIGEEALQFCKTFPTLAPITLPPLQTTTIAPSVDRDLCPVNHVLIPNPIDCSTYYECINYTPVLLNCPIGMLYSCWDQKCMNASEATCITSIQLAANCSKENLKIAHTQHCRKYYECVAGRVVIKHCLIGLQFNGRYQKCMLPEFAHCRIHTTVQPAINVSTSLPVTLSPTDDVCPHEGALLPNPMNCNTFYKCINGTPILQICAVGLEYSCWDTTCLSPVNAQCMATGIHVGQYCSINGKMLQNPNDCQSYYQCTNNSVESKKCPFNGYYNKWFYTCVPFAILAHCQQTPIIASVAPVRHPIQPQILNICPINEELLPDTTDCNSYYKCINNNPVVQRCPDDQEYNCWDQICQLADVAQCISTGSQVGETCSREGVRIPNPENCNSFYECRKGLVELSFCFLGLEYNKWFQKCTIPLYSHCRTYTTMPVPDSATRPSTEIATTIEYTNSVCPQNGLKIPNPNNCHTYFICENLIPVLHSCPDNSNYDCWSQKCDLVILARCVNTPQDNVGKLCFKEGETVPKINDCNRYYICQNGIIVEKSCPIFQQYSIWGQKCMLLGLAKCANSKLLGVI